MWFTASLLIHSRRIEPQVTNLELMELSEGFQQAVTAFMSYELMRRHLRRYPDLWHWEQVLQDFCRYAVAKGVCELCECRYEHLLGYLEHRFLHGITKERLKGEGKVLAEFLRFLWQREGKDRDPLEGEDLMKSLEWLDGWYEENVVLLQASDEKEAWQRAEAFGEPLVAEYQQTANHGVRWEFVGVLSVYEVLDEDLHDGMEVFSRFLTAKGAKMLMKAYRLTTKTARKV